jgi:sugar/nucleoside kinase (ribokinase family)
VVVVGAASRDLASDDPRGWRLGGAVTYAALTLARLGLRVRALVGVDSLAAEARELDLLRAAGAEVALVRLDRGPVFENVEGAGGRIQRCLSESDSVPTSALPAGWDRDPGWMLAPVADELAPEWAMVPLAGAFLAVGWQGMLRTLIAGDVVRRRAPARNALVERANLIGLSRDDLAPDTSPEALLRLIDPRTELVVTEGDGGGRIAASAPGHGRPHPWRRYGAILSDGAVDPTGAGDVLLAAILALRLNPSLAGRPLGRGSDVRLAAAAASLATEAPGVSGVPELDAVLRRLRRRSRRIASA